MKKSTLKKTCSFIPISLLSPFLCNNNLDMDIVYMLYVENLNRAIILYQLSISVDTYHINYVCFIQVINMEYKIGKNCATLKI